MIGFVQCKKGRDTNNTNKQLVATTSALVKCVFCKNFHNNNVLD